MSNEIKPHIETTLDDYKAYAFYIREDAKSRGVENTRLSIYGIYMAVVEKQAAELERYETARQEDAKRLEQVTAEREELFNVAVLSFDAMFEIGVGLAPEELTPRVRALDHALANDLNDELWERINAAALKGGKG